MDPAARVPIELLLEHRAWVQALARALVADESRADDVAQDAWLAALRHPPRHASGLKTWLGRLVRHRAANARRGDARRVAREAATWNPPSSADPADSVARIEAHEHVVRAVLALTEPYRTTVVLRFYEDLSGPEIASRMDVPLETVRTRMKRALAQLREWLDADHGGDGESWSMALLPLAWGTGGIAMKTSTKAGLAAAALLLLGSTAALTWPRREAAPSAPAELPTLAEARKAPAPTPQTKPHDAIAAAVFGEVWRRDPEAPAVGVVVRLTSEGSPDRTVIADARGRFRFDELPPGTRGTVRVATESEAVVPAAVPPLLRDESRSVGVLWLAPTGSIDVLVTTLDGKPLVGARVEALSSGVAYGGRTWIDSAVASATWHDVPDPAAFAATDAAGHATLRRLSRGPWTVVATKPGFVAGLRGGDVGAAVGRQSVRIVLAAGADVAGRVEDRAGRAVAGVVVRAHREGVLDWGQDATTPRAVTGADGRFTLTGLPEGAAALSVARRGAPPTVVATVRVPTSSPVRLVVGGPTISGRVVDVATGAPIAAVRILAHARSWTDAISDEQGAFVISSLVDDLYVNEMRVEKAGYVVVDGPRSESRRLFNLRGDESARLDLKMRRADGLRGTVSHGHAPVRGARVAGLRWGPLGMRSVATTTDGDGGYALDGVAGSTILVQVQAPLLVQPEFDSGNAVGLLMSGKRPPRWSVDVPAQGGATLDVELVAGDDVTGRVLGPGDAPMEGALVGAGGPSTSTAADGGFTLHGVDLRSASFVQAFKAGFAPAWDKPSAGPITLRLVPLPVVRGTVRAEGGPLEGGWVEWAAKPVVPATWYMGSMDAPPPTVEWSGRRAPVAADGTFEIPVVAGTILLRAGGRGHGPSAPVEVTVKDGGPTVEATIDVAAVVTIRGRVVDQDGAAVAGASVELDRRPPRGGRDDGRPLPGVTAAYADADGRFEIPAATSGAHRVFVDADGYLPATIDVGADETVVRLAPAAEIRGTVVWNDGRPVESAMVTVFPKGLPSPFGGAANGTPHFTGVARNGAFRVIVPPGTYTAYVSASENNVSVGRRTFEDVATGASDVKFVIDLGPMIAGRVVGADDGAPFAGARVGVYVEGGRCVANVTSDSEGRFKAEAAGVGSFTVVALSVSTDRSFTSGFVADKRYLRGVAHGVNAGTADVELRLPVGVDIAGSLVDASGAPVVGRWVVAHRLTKYVDDGLNDDAWQDRGACTDLAGRFVVTGLVADAYRLFAADDSGPRRTPLGGGESVTTGARDVRVVLPGISTISGRVVDETGAPFAGVSVSASPADKATWYAAETRPDGTFEIVGVAAFGTYTVSADVNNRAPIRALDVAPGATGVLLKMARGLRASGRLLDAAGKPLARATLIFRTENNDKEAQAITDGEGRFAIENLLPGGYRMENFTFQDGKGVYLPVGTLRAGDENVELRRGN